MVSGRALEQGRSPKGLKSGKSADSHRLSPLVTTKSGQSSGGLDKSSFVSRASTQYFDVDNMSQTFESYVSAHGLSERESNAESLNQFRATLASIRSEKFNLEDRDSIRSTLGARQSIRLLAAEWITSYPLDADITSELYIKKRRYVVKLRRDFIAWSDLHKPEKIIGELLTDDVVAAVRDPIRKAAFKVLCYHAGKGKGEKKLFRKPKWYQFMAADEATAARWISSIRTIVKWQARVPLYEKRKIMIVLNPRSGKRKAERLFTEHVKPTLDVCDIEYDIMRTEYSGHAVDMGKQYKTDAGYETFLFVSGDGTIFEFLNGLMKRPTAEWREIIETTCFSLVSAGTDNGFAIGVGIRTPHAALYCLAKRKQRPVDVLTVTNMRGGPVHYSISGLGFGLPGDIASESESHRWMGTTRYAYLSVKWFLLGRPHKAVVKYVPVVPPPILRRYFDIRDENFVADDQYAAERVSIYNTRSGSELHLRQESKDFLNEKDPTWIAIEGALKDPASLSRYPPDFWNTETFKYAAVGCVDTVPDGKFANPSDGMMDLILARKGSLWASLKQGILYVLGQEMKSELYSYIKVKALIIEPQDPRDCLNIDGEVLKGPGPFHAEVIPRLLKVLSEK